MSTPCQFRVDNSDQRNITYTTSINPTTYGLNSFDLTIDFSQIEENNILIFIQDGSFTSAVTVILNEAQTTIVAVNSAKPAVATAFLSGSNNFALIYRNGSTSVTWNLAFDPNGPNIVGVQIPCPILLNDGTDVFPSPTDSGTRIVIIAQRSPDGQELCQVNFTITSECCTATSVVQEYILYCPKIGSVLCASGCTFGEKVAQLSLKLNISSTLLFRNISEYALMRMALSKLLYGNFDVNYLRQNYYKEFIRGVARCYPDFLPFFDGSNPNYPYRTYWTFFKC